MPYTSLPLIGPVRKQVFDYFVSLIILRTNDALHLAAAHWAGA
jgi:hypothetical protein